MSDKDRIAELEAALVDAKDAIHSAYRGGCSDAANFECGWGPTREGHKEALYDIARIDAVLNKEQKG